MDELVVRTQVYADPDAVYEFLVDFPRYAHYSEYLREVRTVEGDGGPGTRYALTFAWWKLTYIARSRVTGVDPPRRIDWKITKDINAGGCWRVTPMGGDGGGESDGGDGDGESDGGDGDGESDGGDGEDDGSDDDGEDDDGDGEDDGSDTPVCEVALEVEFDPSSASSDALDLPRLVSFDWVLKKAIPLIRTEAERVVERAVRDLEGSTRDVDLDVYVDSDRI